MVQIIIEVEGGVVQAVFSDAQGLDVSVLDHDNWKACAHDPEGKDEAKGYQEMEDRIETLIQIQ